MGATEATDGYPPDFGEYFCCLIGFLSSMMIMNWVFDPPRRNILPVIGTEAVFPVGNVFCVGRNYADHAVEMGGDPDREPPFFYQAKLFSSFARP